MAHRRPWHCYAKWNRRPFQHKRNWNHKREYARGGTQSKISRFWGGDPDVPWDKFDLVLGLKCDRQVQISSNSLESVRVGINSVLQNSLPKGAFRLRIRPKPFQKIRENRMLAFAGADRVQTGMRNSFGRCIGVAARVRAGQIIADLGINLKDLPLARERLRIASMKIPSTSQVVILKYKSVDIFKKSGLPLYNATKRIEIPLYEVAGSAQPTLQ